MAWQDFKLIGFAPDLPVTTPGAFPDIVSGTQTVGTRTRFDLTAGSHRYYLLWITRLGPRFKYARVTQVNAST